MIITIGKRRLLWGIIITTFVHAGTIPVTQRKSGGKPQCTLELFCERTEAFLSERIPFKVRVRYDTKTYNITSITSPEQKDLLFEPLSAPIKTQETMDGVVCTQYEWRGFFYPQKIGQFSLQPFKVIGEQRTTTSHGFMSMMTSVPMTCQSNSVGMNVLPLPRNSEHATSIVGSFYGISLEIEHTRMKAGQACNLIYHIQGEGNVHLVGHPELCLPNELTCYPAEIRKEEHGYRFDYVVHAKNEGVVTIPAQKLVYFDPHSRQYSSLVTRPILLHIEPGVTHNDPTIPSPNFISYAPYVDQTVEDDVSLNEFKLSFIRSVEIPQTLFSLCVIGLLFIMLGRALYPWFKTRYIHLKVWWYRKRLLARARNFLKSEASPDALGVYIIFKELHETLDTSVIQRYDAEKISAWQTFLQRLACERFAQQKNHTISEKFIQEAREWITYFEKL